jgi:hypothetical protein
MNFIENWYRIVYQNFARGNILVGRIITFGGLAVGVFVALALILGLIQNPHPYLDSVPEAIIYAIAFCIMVAAFVVFGSLLVYFFVLVTRCILNPKNEYNCLILFFERINQRIEHDRLMKGRCAKCGIKSIYTRVDGSVRCSKCGWDSRFDH